MKIRHRLVLPTPAVLALALGCFSLSSLGGCGEDLKTGERVQDNAEVDKGRQSMGDFMKKQPAAGARPKVRSEMDKFMSRQGNSR